MERPHDAVSSFNHAIELKPDFAEARFNRGMTLLLLGDFERGLTDYEWRLKNDDGSFKDGRAALGRQWRGGESLAGRRILLSAEQGLGDTLQFCRYAPQIAELGATVILQVQPSLKPLVVGLPGVSQVVSSEEPLPNTDCQARYSVCQSRLRLGFPVFR
jgi:hypothetical protein